MELLAAKHSASSALQNTPTYRPYSASLHQNHLKLWLSLH
ncbi:hypothetical protein HMPREF0971_00543 [Segatella oris F0302]|uniref:Uncharacterized protein n=1 Tax=Segatella oris F0302 TaxID=649760 RepID=D1QNP3_9BACT|nr:hypothetical protein HMPREF0971_00543 [Segatella oris F0302]